MKFRSFFRPMDWVIAIITLSLCFGSIFLLTGKNQGNPILSVNCPDGEFLYQLDKDQEINVQGKKGLSVIKICQGEARFMDSPCTNHTCITSPPVSRNGEWSACLPNGIFLSVRAENQAADIDIIAY